MLLMFSFLFNQNLANVFAEEVDKGRFWEHYAINKYPDLNKNEEYNKLFKSFGDFEYLLTYFSKDSYPKRYNTYQKFLIRVLEDAIKGDVGEAMFVNAVILFTPASIIMEMIASEIGAGGHLEGVLETPNDIAKHLQRQNQQGYAGDPNFDHYVHFLKGRTSKGIADKPNTDVVIRHMFQTDSHRAFIAMLKVEYGFNPYPSKYTYSSMGEDTTEVKKLQIAQHEIEDFLYRSRYAFTIPEELATRVKLHLKGMKSHKKWWVRLYAASILKKAPDLKK